MKLFKKSNEVAVKREPKLYESIFSMLFLIVCLAIGIIVFKADPHIPMFVGSFGTIFIALRQGYSYSEIEEFMIKGIKKVMPSILILIVIGILIGVWLSAGVVPTMIYYGLKIINPSIFYVATVLICSITSIATGSSWGTVGTMGVAFMGIAYGLGLSLPVTAGAIISGAYFGDKMSPLSDTTNLSAGMAGCDVMTNIKFMILPTSISYIISLIIFFFLGLGAKGSGADLSSVKVMSDSLTSMFNITPFHFIPIIIVLVAVSLKVPSVPGIFLGVISGIVVGLIFEPNLTISSLLDAGMNGFVSNTGIESIDSLLSSGGLLSMMYSSSMAIIAMIFGGVMEETGQLKKVADILTKKAKKPADVVALTEVTSIISDVVMPDQYISMVVPGRMFAEKYKELKLHPKTLANALASSGALASVLVPWNTCGLFVSSALHLNVIDYLPFAFFNYLTPIIVVILAYARVTVADSSGARMISKKSTFHPHLDEAES